MPNKRLLVCDVEGTIFKADTFEGIDYQSTLWKPIAEALGQEAAKEELKIMREWDKGEFPGYLSRVRASIQVHRKYNLKKELFKKVVNEASYNDGVEDFFKNLDRTKWIPVLISGGFEDLVRRVQKDFDIDYGYGACEYIFDENGNIDHYNLTLSDFDAKLNHVQQIIDEYGLNINKDWVFIGDGLGDKEMAERAPLALCINPHPKLKSVEDVIEIHSFTEISKHLPKLRTINRTKYFKLSLHGKIDLDKNKKKYIIDTNVFIDNPNIIFEIQRSKNNAVVVPAKVIDELDRLKLNRNLKDEAQRAIRLIMRNKDIIKEQADMDLLPPDFDSRNPDNIILAVALKYKDKRHLLLTNDFNLINKAEALGLKASNQL